MKICVSELLNEGASDLQLALIAGERGLAGEICSFRLQKPGLALSGYVDYVHADRVQLLGSTELAYLASLSTSQCQKACDGLVDANIVCLICTKGMTVPQALIDACERTRTPLLTTPQLTGVFAARAESFLENMLAPQAVMHGVLLEVFGTGVFLLGKSGIGKSECALDLVQRGHSLVADDVVTLRRRGMETVYGSGTGMLVHHLEIRGLGILNVRDLYGVTAVRDKKRVDLVVELVLWRDDEEYDRLGLEERRFPILDVELPLLTVPVRPGRNMGSIIEVAARNQMLKSMGTNTAAEFSERLERALAPGRRAHTDDVD